MLREVRRRIIISRTLYSPPRSRQRPVYMSSRTAPHSSALRRLASSASAAMTLDTYADLFDDDLDGVATALD